MISNSRVAVHAQQNRVYAAHPPFHAPEAYPEYPFGRTTNPENEAYTSVRECLRMLGLDEGNFGKAAWNPLGEIVRPGNTVLIKPNMIAHKPVNSDAWECVITHGSVIRAVVDYVYLALRGEGKIIIADAPQEDSDVEMILSRMGIGAIQDLYRREKNFLLEFRDLRDKHRVVRDGVFVATENLPGDPLGNARANLGKHSFLAEHDGRGKKYYGAYYDIEETNAHHSNGVHEYMISRTALAADVFISVPKLKTHKKVGVTLNLKSLVGINGQKNWLPHYALGSPSENGDQFPEKSVRGRLENSVVLRMKALLLKGNSIAQFAARNLKSAGYRLFGDTEKVVRSGNWHGNDTCWRMTLDLNRILLYADMDGALSGVRKRYFSIVDGIVGMEGNGPVAGVPKQAGLVAAGCDPAAVDVVCATLMGFDFRKIALLHRAFDQSPYPLSLCVPEGIAVTSNRAELGADLESLRKTPFLEFEPHFGWKGHTEIAR